MPDYLRYSSNREADKEASRMLTMKIHNDFSNVFIVIDCFEGMSKMQMRDSSHPYQALPRRVAYVLQEPLQEELNKLKQQQIIVPAGIDETSEWCNNFVLVPKANGKFMLSLELA